MKRIVLFPIVCFLLLVSCLNKKEDKVNLSLRPPMVHLVDSFINIYHPAYVELHVNKVTSHYLLMLLYGGDSPLTQQCEVWNTKIGKHNVAIYTGMEDFLELHRNEKEYNAVDTTKAKQGHYWIIRELLNKRSISKADASVRSPFKPALPFITPEELIISNMEDSIYNLINSHCIVR